MPSLYFLLIGNHKNILGDFSAHHENCFSDLGCDTSGEIFSMQMDGADFCTINENLPTRIVHNCRSFPDLSIVSPDLVAAFTWQADIALNSDHIPIIIEVA